ncbi:hypothetical protein PHMEG_00035655 [Phytophthora megakarya]|uniref:Uncharacterized protein n=1 Tax=Phytophthora megakarya TaxID=4795 RepID=A0A225UNK5_9STRA|nr:hypothetical protein PHMEG_00035655 [Phytophthora megakarya]
MDADKAQLALCGKNLKSLRWMQMTLDPYLLTCMVCITLVKLNALLSKRLYLQSGAIMWLTRLCADGPSTSPNFVNSHRFSRWQTFRTLSGYAATNNPLDQYHRTVGIQRHKGKTNPSELMKTLVGRSK